jgi:hypothetical protein
MAYPCVYAIKCDVEMKMAIFLKTSSLNGDERLCFSCFTLEGRASVAHSPTQGVSQSVLDMVAEKFLALRRSQAILLVEAEFQMLEIG